MISLTVRSNIQSGLSPPSSHRVRKARPVIIFVHGLRQRGTVSDLALHNQGGRLEFTHLGQLAHRHDADSSEV